ncbi:MAG TPA: phosphatidylglycerophosphatase A [Desulfobacteraceae bacterium]|jgi:phosphatidylglycerophosphatase A|nr:phosphatidylglycerophosphatase A [Desulfobacteraceae bacterium]
MWKCRFDNVSYRTAKARSGKGGGILNLIAVWFGSGLSPVAPGTAGTLAAVPLILIAGCFGLFVKIALLVVLIFVAVWSSDFYRRRSGVEDPPEVVVDEVVGFFTTVGLWKPSWSLLLAGFLLFRFFDIVKPFPVGMAERLPGGLGIVADDLVAGIYSALGLWGLFFAGVLS